MKLHFCTERVEVTNEESLYFLKLTIGPWPSSSTKITPAAPSASANGGTGPANFHEQFSHLPKLRPGFGWRRELGRHQGFLTAEASCFAASLAKRSSPRHFALTTMSAWGRLVVDMPLLAQMNALLFSEGLPRPPVVLVPLGAVAHA